MYEVVLSHDAARTLEKATPGMRRRIIVALGGKYWDVVQYFQYSISIRSLTYSDLTDTLQAVGS